MNRGFLIGLSTSVAIALLAGCGGSQSQVSMSAAASSGHAAPIRLGSRSFHGYYLAKFITVVGSNLNLSSLCLRFKASGAWSSVPPNAFDNGTYLISTSNELFASAQAPWSPVIYATLQGSINGTQGSGYYIVMQPTGAIYSGATFTMTRVQKGCA